MSLAPKMPSEPATLCPTGPATRVEEWRAVPGSEGHYSVSNHGRVRSEPISGTAVGRQRGGILRCHRDTKGYRQFCMCLPDGRNLRMKVHRAVALAFMGPRPDGAQINHISGDKTDNSLANLEYISCRENVRHSWENGLRRAEQTCGERHGRAKLTEAQIREIRSSYGHLSTTQLARRFGVSVQNIGQILKHQTWRHVA
jgi:DNA-binding transcriptional regulator YiaG